MSKEKISKFFLVGVFNTGINLLLIFILTGLYEINIILSSTISFIVSNILSYIVNSKLVFYKKICIYLYFRFLIASLFSFFINFSLNTLFYILNFHYLLATLICIILVPALTYFTHNKWTWKN
jgi:putative flippase GtrA